MVTDSKGSRFINVDMLFKQLAGYLLTFIISAGAFAYISITVAKNEMENIKERNEYLSARFADMKRHNEELSQAIEEKNEEIALIGDKFENLESEVVEDSIETRILGEDSTLLSRIDTASITALQKSFIMKFVPNGAPISPLQVSAPYGRRYHPITHVYHIHTGIDLVAPMNTAVYATADGVVDWASDKGNGGYGKLVKISHSFGFRTYYAHLNAIKVQRGQFVKKGQLIALSGSSGASTGPHLHYEVRFLGKPIEPINFISWDMQNFNAIFEKERNISWHSLVQTISKLMERRPAPPLLSQPVLHSRAR